MSCVALELSHFRPANWLEMNDVASGDSDSRFSETTDILK